MTDALIETIRKIFLYKPRTTTLSVGEIVETINDEKLVVKPDGSAVNQIDVATALLSISANDISNLFDIKFTVRMKAPTATFSINGKPVNKKQMLAYMKLERETNGNKR